jgi:hypothetical protein
MSQPPIAKAVKPKPLLFSKPDRRRARRRIARRAAEIVEILTMGETLEHRPSQIFLRGGALKKEPRRPESCIDASPIRNRPGRPRRRRIGRFGIPSQAALEIGSPIQPRRAPSRRVPTNNKTPMSAADSAEA